MQALEQFRLTLKAAEYIELNLEKLAKYLATEGKANSPEYACYNNLLVDLRKLYPDAQVESVANDLITEKCRVHYLRMVEAKRSTNWMQDR